MELYDYQQRIIEEINAKSHVKRLCVQLSTGGGKTVIFSHIAKNTTENVLILVDAAELVSQTAKALGGDCSIFESKNKAFPNSRIVVAMSKTILSRLKKDEKMLNRFGLAIIDEAHIYVHNKIFDFLPETCNIVGFTATPCRSARVTFEDEYGDEWIRDETMSEVYNDIVCGIGTDELIERGFLVDEELHCISVAGIDTLVKKGDDYTNESLNNVFNKPQYCIDVMKEFVEKCKGKKTMIFTATTEANLSLFHKFISEGYNCKLYDSVNSSSKDREGIVRWFRDTPASILFNVSCFTKGFDVRDVEAIILARKVSSLSLFIQIAGRGARTTDKIYKDRFIFIDGGENSKEFGMWSAPRDWGKIFFNGYRPTKKKKESLLDVVECDVCGYMRAKHETPCPECGEETVVEEKGSSKKQKVETKTTEIKKVIYPDSKKIIGYTKRKNEDVFFALNILNNQIFDIFIRAGVDKQLFLDTLRNKNFYKRMHSIMRPHFFEIIYSDLKSYKNRTYEFQLSLLVDKLKKYYK